MNATIKRVEKPRITTEQIQNHLEMFDWDAHWQRVLAKVSKETEAFERARATSRAQAARKVFV